MTACRRTQTCTQSPAIDSGVASLQDAFAQAIDLQEDRAFQALDVELLSIALDPVDAWREAGREMGIRDYDGVLSDGENKVAASYGVMRWAVGGEPGHTFVLVDEAGEVAWLQDYGALEN